MADPSVPPGPRPPHSLATHFAIDGAVTFLATIVLGLILGTSILVVGVIAVVAGLCLAPFTRRTEERQLAERQEQDTRPPDGEPR